MGDKSFVTMGQEQCVICGELYNTGELLIDKRMRDTFDKYTTTGVGNCPEHKKLAADDYVALIEVNNPHGSGSTLQFEEAIRTGRCTFIKREAAAHVFDTPASKYKKPNGDQMPILFIDIEAMEKILEMYQAAPKE